MTQEIDSKITCQPISGDIVKGFSECLENQLFNIVFFSIIAIIITLLMLISLYGNDLKLFFREARVKISLGIIFLIIIDVVLELIIYSLFAFLLYPLYQEIVKIPHAKILIFAITCYIIVDILISNKDEDYITEELDTALSGFGFGTGIYWINAKLLGVIRFLKYFHNVIASWLLDTYLEDEHREPLIRKLLENMNTKYPNPSDIETIIIQKLKDKIKKRRNHNLFSQRLENIKQQYDNNNDEQKLRARLVELAVEIYSVKTIEKWKDNDLPF
ncbi:hypothetical protein PCC8801_3915 [Rippkaea orientalis PCC 8801]|uniref:Uncharacterized protein n=1 Tax=Rippkaea orientalis (strain PCC 8801 / RF-1) TaxID=41431 RepID=B7K535_RIPO1|nr:hypothetical protein [Rippkaea orientalis]ACK67861.1 hypothetical protein PCC8801_3915 [Rippkaea orientalis PCC 8801]